MKTLANRIREGLEKFGYEYNQAGQFSVEMTDGLVIINESIDLSPLTKERDKLSLTFYLSGTSTGGRLLINYVSASLYRYPKHQYSKNGLGPKILMDQKYFSEHRAIPTKDQLYQMVVERLNIGNSATIDLIKNCESRDGLIREMRPGR